jgi:hypothetical protein
MRRSSSAIVALFALLLVPAVLAQTVKESRPTSSASLALVITYADGRVSHELVWDKPASAWTPYFPRTSGASGTSDGRALQLTRVRAGDDARVTVSMLSGPLYRDEQLVATATVSRRQPVRIDELRAFGAEPIVLSVVDSLPMSPYMPSVISVAPEIDVSRVDLVDGPVPGYRITLRNTAPQAVALFSMQSYRGTAKALSTVERGDRGLPLMAPGQSHSFTIPINTGHANPGTTVFVPEPLDMIEIDSVVWEDGTVIGRHGGVPLSSVITYDGGRRLQFERALEVLHAAQSQKDRNASQLLAQIRRGFNAMPETDETRLEPARRTMRITREMVLRDLEYVEALRITDAAEMQRRIQLLIAKYEDRLKRLAL